MKSTRRNALKIILSAPLFAATSGASAKTARTPSAAEGPYYPRKSMRFPDIDNDLVKILGSVERAGGEIVELKGRVLDRSGRPAREARIEIWQCDVNGRYLHTRDRGGKARDAAFQGFGHFLTGPDGTFEFRTIKPVPYPGRTPHIHVKVFHGRHRLTTQLYIADHPQNERDWLYQRMSPAQKRAVSMTFANGLRTPQATTIIRL